MKYIAVLLTSELEEFLKSERTEGFTSILRPLFDGKIVEIPQEVNDGDVLLISRPPIDWRWDCESPDSPDGKCAYAKDDIMEDSCIYCGQPDERK